MLAASSLDTHMPAQADHRVEDRRKKPRFALSFPAFVWTPSLGREWAHSKTINVSSGGAVLETTMPVSPDSPIEYVVTFPSDLTHAVSPLRVRFCGRVLRVETQDENPGYRVAVFSSTHKYLSREAAEPFAALDRPHPPSESLSTEPVGAPLS